MSEPVALESLGGPTGFRKDARFALVAEPAPPPPPSPEPETPPDDPIALAFAEGFAAGCAAAQAEAEEQARIAAEAREALSLAFVRLDHELEEELRLRLRDTVAALCEAAVAPLALDADALMRRIEKAVSMLARADDERIIRLHPDDIALISPRLAMDWQIVPDSSLERGGLRVESTSGGVEDGPAVWRRAIAEALRQC
jgi:flagellar assembly protein FliH